MLPHIMPIDMMAIIGLSLPAAISIAQDAAETAKKNAAQIRGFLSHFE